MIDPNAAKDSKLLLVHAPQSEVLISRWQVEALPIPAGVRGEMRLQQIPQTANMQFS